MKNKFLIFFLMVTFCFKVLGAEGQDLIILEKLNLARIEEKSLEYQKLLLAPTKFKKLVYTIGIGAAAVLATSFVLKKFNKKKAESSQGNENQNSSSISTNRLEDHSRKSRSIWDICKRNAAQGLIDGFYWGGVAVVGSGCTVAAATFFDVCKQKFFQMWNGQEQERFYSICKQLQLSLEQIRIFLTSPTGVTVDKDEIVEDFSILVLTFENLLAFVQAKRAVLENDRNNMALTAILNLKKILQKDFVDFSNELENELVKQDSNSDLILNSFEKLKERVERFVNTFWSVFYVESPIHG